MAKHQVLQEVDFSYDLIFLIYSQLLISFV